MRGGNISHHQSQILRENRLVIFLTNHVLWFAGQATDMHSLILYRHQGVVLIVIVHSNTKIPRTMFGIEKQGQVDNQMNKLVMRSNRKSKFLRLCSVADGHCDEILIH